MVQITVIGSFKALILEAVSVEAEMDAIVDGFKIILSLFTVLLLIGLPSPALILIIKL